MSQDIFVARQRIFDRGKRVVGYELLFRSSLSNVFTRHDQDQASIHMMDTTLLGFGLDSLVGKVREDKPPELLVTALIRAQFCEQVGRVVGMSNRDVDLFLVGMLSMLDSMLGPPLELALSDMPVAQEIKDTLLGSNTSLSRIYLLVRAYERADWENCRRWPRAPVSRWAVCPTCLVSRCSGWTGFSRDRAGERYGVLSAERLRDEN